MKGKLLASALLAGLLVTFSSVSGAPSERSEDRTSTTVKKATAVIKPTKGSNVQGVVVFVQEKGGVRIIAAVEGLSEGAHGFHVHENGDCSAPNAESAGDHFNPAGNPHGGPNDLKRHVGDVGNLEANVYGKVYTERVDPVISLNGPNSIVGRSVVIHANPDDLKSQPAGGAGARIGCGVIVASR